MLFDNHYYLYRSFAMMVYLAAFVIKSLASKGFFWSFPCVRYTNTLIIHPFSPKYMFMHSSNWMLGSCKVSCMNIVKCPAFRSLANPASLLALSLWSLSIFFTCTSSKSSFNLMNMWQYFNSWGSLTWYSSFICPTMTFETFQHFIFFSPTSLASHRPARSASHSV